MHPVRFELTPPKRSELESDALDRSATDALLLEVGFEPTHPKITELKSAALDRSATQAIHSYINLTCVFY